MRLNPKKCSFGVEEGPFLGHLITKQGIKSNPSKVKAVTDLDQPRTLKDIQSLNGKLAVLSRFLSKGAERSLAFFKVLKGNEKEMPADFLVKIPFEDNDKKEKPKEVPDSSSKWRLCIDGASNSDRSGVGLMLTDLKGTYAPKQTSIKGYLQKVKTALRGFKEYIVEHVRRNQNKKADALSKLASMTFEHLTKEVLVEILTKRLIEEKEVLKADMQERKS
ncbi:reverse transcriptase domain-containing protein [Tanacetum coccineum]